jgi:hypothetical protein
MFEENGIACSNVASLISKWSSSGLDEGSALPCQRCSALRAHKKSKGQIPNGTEPRSSSSRLIQSSVLSFPKSGLPPHLYFQVDAVPIVGNNQKEEFMGQLIWPFKLRILGEEYTLILRGYWGNDHYWGKVLRTVQGVTGVWLHNDLNNAGYAQMVSSVPQSISGAHPNTS